MIEEYDPNLGGTKREQALAQVAFGAYMSSKLVLGDMWHELNRREKEAWIKAIQAVDKASEPSGPD